MSLGSALLKRLFVHKALGIPWKDIKFARKRDPVHGKPCALLSSSSTELAPLEFNVSHQAGLVALVGCKTEELNAELGVDIVCVNERNDYRTIDADGFDAWVDIYSEIFSHEESFDMKYNGASFPLLDGTMVTPEMLQAGRYDRCVRRHQKLRAKLNTGEEKTFDSELLIDAKLRRFYTFWCYKEAYIKLDGEALLAQWIPQLEFKNVRAPLPGTVARCSTHGTWGERAGDAEVWFTKAKGKGGPAGVETQNMREGEDKRLEDTRVEIQAFEEAFMIGVAAKMKDGSPEGQKLPAELTKFVSLDIEADLMDIARSA